MERPKRRVFLALGTNLGDRWQYLREAVVFLEEVFVTSPVYETDPIGGPEGQGPYLNMVVQLFTSKSPQAILRMAQACEKHAGRVRTVKDGPRTLDVDVIWIDGEPVNDPNLVVPHPRMWERRFVLAPLNDIAPDLMKPGWQANALGHVEQVGSL